MIFNLNSLGKAVLTNYEFGQAVRKQINLDKEEKNNSVICIIIPDNLYSISSSFIRGLLEKSILQFTNKEEFYKKFKFEGKREFLVVIDCMVTRTLIHKKFHMENMSFWKKMFKKIFSSFKYLKS